jgi:hypothetical protein
MDENMHQGHEPEHVDLTQVEGKPGARVDPLFERQTDDAQFAGRRFRVRFYSDTPVRSPTGAATALLKLVLAAGLPAAGVAAVGWAVRAAAWLTITLAALMFTMVGGVGLFLILQTQPKPRAHREISRNNTEGPRGDADPGQGNRGETGEQHTRRHTKPTRRHKALQPPRRR